LARHPGLQNSLLDKSLKKIFACQRRRARSTGGQMPFTGSVTFCQRFGSLLNLNCHFHSLLPDGVFAYDKTGDVLQFVPLPAPQKRK